MTRLNSTPVSEAALSGSMRDFRVPQGPDALARVENFFSWQDERRRHGVWPFSRAAVTGPGATVNAEDDSGHAMQGVNFASQDYLSLAAHPQIRAAAIEAIETYGVHSAGSAALVGNSANSLLLERRIGEFLNAEHVTLYPTGWGAGYGALRGLICSTDHIVMDALAHTCLQEGANAATRSMYMHRHLDLAHCRHWLQKIRARDTENAIMVVTEGLFSMDSDVPDIEAFQALAHEYGATLMVDVAHDLGALGPGGRGHIGAQNMLGKVDLVMGSFSKTFGSNGGFVASKSRAVKEYLRFFSPTTTFSNALSPVQCAIVTRAFEIVDSAEGDLLRDKMMGNVLNLRSTLNARGLEVFGEPSAIVCVKMGSEALARLVCRRLPEAGLLANLVEYPAVGRGAARFRMQVMANHSPENIARAVDILHSCHQEALVAFDTRDEAPLEAVS
jgi:7-keto-8-aminopelargonate synthetase-like enzyme